MAHEINNPLAGMIQTARLMKSRLEGLELPANLRVAEEIGVSMMDIRAFMDVVSVPDRGATFIIRLPLERPLRGDG